jgi:prepilin-type N-terminal cleavage/methylation domain-containing protein
LKAGILMHPAIKRKHNRGFTLIEIIIAFAILGIVTAMFFSFFVFGNNTYKLGTEQYDVQSDIRTSSDYIVESVRFSTSVSLIPMTTPLTKDADFNYLYVQDGNIYSYVWNGSSHDFKKIGSGITSASFTGAVENNKTVLSVLLQGNKGEQDYTITTETELPNLSLKGQTLDSSGQVIKYSSSMDYAYDGPTEAPSTSPSPSPSTSPSPTSTPLVTAVTVTFSAPGNNYSVKFNGADIAVSGSPPRDFVISGVPVNADYDYEIKKGSNTVTGTLTVEEEDMKFMIPDL